MKKGGFNYTANNYNSKNIISISKCLNNINIILDSYKTSNFMTKQQ